jgi:hypothetical protein
MRIELNKWNIDIRPAENVILYRDMAYRFSSFVSDREIKMCINRCIRDSKKRKDAHKNARQITLIEVF